MEAWWTVVGVVAVFLARMLQSVIYTVREILMVRGSRASASLLSLVETTVWFLSFYVVIRDLFSGPFDSTVLLKSAGFLLGWATGVYLGIEVEERMARGHATVQVISTEKEREMREKLLSKGFPLTSIKGRGRRGPRIIYQIVIPRRELSRLLRLIDRVDPKAFVTILETRGVMRGVGNSKK